jgi:hypothetical protein
MAIPTWSSIFQPILRPAFRGSSVEIGNTVRPVGAPLLTVSLVFVSKVGYAVARVICVHLKLIHVFLVRKPTVLSCICVYSDCFSVWVTWPGSDSCRGVGGVFPLQPVWVEVLVPIRHSDFVVVYGTVNGVRVVLQPDVWVYPVVDHRHLSCQVVVVLGWTTLVVEALWSTPVYVDFEVDVNRVAVPVWHYS